VDFKLENVLVSLHSLKSIIFKEWRVTWTFSYTYVRDGTWRDLCV